MDVMELYNVGGKDIYVNRGDLQGDGIEYPAWGKIKAVEEIFNSDLVKRDITLMHLNAYGSWTGWALGLLCKKYDMKFHMAFPARTDFPKEYLRFIEKMGVEVHSFKPNMDSLLRNKLVGICNKEGYQYFNSGFDCNPFLEYFQKSMKEVVYSYDIDTLVVSGGSGVTLAGLVMGFECYSTLFSANTGRKVYAIVVSSKQGGENALKRKGIVTNQVEVIKSEYEYNDRMDWYETPFPTNPFWDRKAWHWLENNVNKLDGRVLFWNLGGNDNFFI